MWGTTRLMDERAAARAEAAEAEAAAATYLNVGNNDPDVNAAELDEDVDDPQNETLLTTYNGHRAKEIWKGNDPGPLNRFLNRIFGLRSLAQLPEQVRTLVLGSGLAPLIDSSYQMTDRRILSSFVERFYEDTCTFHLPCGEITVTLDDVLSLLHIPVTSYLIPWDKPSKLEAVVLLHEVLGVSTEEATEEVNRTKGGAFSFSALTRWLKQFIDQNRYEHAARCYLLYLVGSTLFIDKTVNSTGVQFHWSSVTACVGGPAFCESICMGCVRVGVSVRSIG